MNNKIGLDVIIKYVMLKEKTMLVVGGTEKNKGQSQTLLYKELQRHIIHIKKQMISEDTTYT